MKISLVALIGASQAVQLKWGEPAKCTTKCVTTCAAPEGCTPPGYILNCGGEFGETGGAAALAAQ